MLEKLDVIIILIFFITFIILIVMKKKEYFSGTNINTTDLTTIVPPTATVPPAADPTTIIEPVIPFIDPIYRRQIQSQPQDPVIDAKEIADLQQQFNNQNQSYQEEDPADNYRHTSRSILYIEDPTLKSSNYSEFASYIRPDQLDNRLTDEKKKGYKTGDYGVLNLPVGYGYGFLDSPAVITKSDPQMSKTIL